MKLTYKNRPVEIDGTLEVNEGFWVNSGHFLDGNKEPLLDAELDFIQEEFHGQLYHSAYENMAAYAYDRAKDARKYGDS